jgi:hypothetical protein
MATALRKTEANDGRANSAAEPACGQCGYCVRGIEGLICPECGSDLREVGIVTPGNRRASSVWLKLGLWTLALPVPALLISLLLLRTVIPFSRTTKVQRVIFLDPPYLHTTLEVSGVERHWRPVMADPNPGTPQTLRIEELTKGTIIQVDLKAGAYAYRDSAGGIVQHASGFNGGVLADWLANAGCNPKDLRVRQLCDSAYAAINEVPQGPKVANKFTHLAGPPGTPTGTAHPAFFWTVYDEPHPAVIAVLALAWLSLWIYGMRRIARRHGRRATGGR